MNMQKENTEPDSGSQEISTNDIFLAIDELKNQSGELSPQILDWLFTTEEIATSQIDDAMSRATKAQANAIDAVFDGIRAFVRAREESIRKHSPREPEFIQGTFDQMCLNVHRVSEGMALSLYQVFLVNVDLLRRIPGLTGDQKKERIRCAYSRALNENREVIATYRSMLDKVAIQLQTILREIDDGDIAGTRGDSFS